MLAPMACAPQVAHAASEQLVKAGGRRSSGDEERR